MFENVCQQCQKVPNVPYNRIIQDSCGHKKCRTCLLEDSELCKQCSACIGQVKDIDQTELPERNSNASESSPSQGGVIQVNGNVTDYNKPDENLVNGEKYEFSENSKKSRLTDNVTEQQKECDLQIKKNGRRQYQFITIPAHISFNSDTSVYHCRICNRRFITKRHVKYHSYCGGAPKLFRCEICQKEFSLKTQLDRHSYQHNNRKPYSCQECKKTFSEQSKLTRHWTVHSKLRSHVCTFCGNAYKSKESLRLHNIIHRDQKPYSCKLCSARFNNASNLNKHIATHSNEKSHMCDQCGKRFKQKLSLAVHRKSHSRGRVHQCEICSKSFVNNKDLKRHCLTHAETRGYGCGLCKTSFRRKDNLLRHIKNTHPGKAGDDVIDSVVLPPSAPRKAIPPVDNPNAINVITSVPPTVVESDCRTADPAAGGIFDRFEENKEEEEEQMPKQQCVINGPIKLAFKTPAFKSNYNIIRNSNYVPPPQYPGPHEMAESIDICQKILATDSNSQIVPIRNNIYREGAQNGEVNPKMGSPQSSRPIHYETSFQNRKHAIIKNIKFKVPEQYTSNFKSPARGTNKDEANIGETSVIVNNSNTNLDINVHWRRRTSQNLGLKN